MIFLDERVGNSNAQCKFLTLSNQMSCYIRMSYECNTISDWIKSKFATVYSVILCCKPNVITKWHISLAEIWFYIAKHVCFECKVTLSER